MIHWDDIFWSSWILTGDRKIKRLDQGSYLKRLKLKSACFSFSIKKWKKKKKKKKNKKRKKEKEHLYSRWNLAKFTTFQKNKKIAQFIWCLVTYLVNKKVLWYHCFYFLSMLLFVFLQFLELGAVKLIMEAVGRKLKMERLTLPAP